MMTLSIYYYYILILLLCLDVCSTIYQLPNFFTLLLHYYYCRQQGFWLCLCVSFSLSWWRCFFSHLIVFLFVVLACSNFQHAINFLLLGSGYSFLVVHTQFFTTWYIDVDGDIDFIIVAFVFVIFHFLL